MKAERAAKKERKRQDKIGDKLKVEEEKSKPASIELSFAKGNFA